MQAVQQRSNEEIDYFFLISRDSSWHPAFSVLGWIICFVSIVGGAFLVFGYGITFGNDKTYR